MPVQEYNWQNLPPYFPLNGTWFNIQDVQHNHNIGAHLDLESKEAKEHLEQLEKELEK